MSTIDESSGRRPPQERKAAGTPLVRWVCLGAAAVLLAAALLPPISTLAAGILFSAHMLQHLMLLLIVPGLWVLSRGPRPAAANRPPARKGMRSALIAGGWIGGVGSMWFWHIPQLCDAAAGVPTVHWVQVVSLLVLGTAFWWSILAPNCAERLSPGAGVAYLATACFACTALGIILTLAPIDVCPIFRAPTAAYRIFTADEDRQIGGLIMWLPMCLIYLAAILYELARWLSPKSQTPLAT